MKTLKKVWFGMLLCVLACSLMTLTACSDDDDDDEQDYRLPLDGSVVKTFTSEKRSVDDDGVKYTEWYEISFTDTNWKLDWYGDADGQKMAQSYSKGTWTGNLDTKVTLTMTHTVKDDKWESASSYEVEVEVEIVDGKIANWDDIIKAF